MDSIKKHGQEINKLQTHHNAIHDRVFGAPLGDETPFAKLAEEEKIVSEEISNLLVSVSELRQENGGENEDRKNCLDAMALYLNLFSNSSHALAALLTNLALKSEGKHYPISEYNRDLKSFQEHDEKRMAVGNDLSKYYFKAVSGENSYQANPSNRRPDDHKVTPSKENTDQVKTSTRNIETQPNKLKGFFSGLGIAVYFLAGVWGLVLCFEIIQKASSTFWAIISIFLFPAVLGLAPLYAVIENGNWLPSLVVFGGGVIGMGLMGIASSLPDKIEIERLEVEDQEEQSETSLGTIIFLIVIIWFVFNLAFNRDEAKPPPHTKVVKIPATNPGLTQQPLKESNNIGEIYQSNEYSKQDDAPNKPNLNISPQEIILLNIPSQGAAPEPFVLEESTPLQEITSDNQQAESLSYPANTKNNISKTIKAVNYKIFIPDGWEPVPEKLIENNKSLSDNNFKYGLQKVNAGPGLNAPYILIQELDLDPQSKAIFDTYFPKNLNIKYNPVEAMQVLINDIDWRFNHFDSADQIVWRQSNQPPYTTLYGGVIDQYRIVNIFCYQFQGQDLYDWKDCLRVIKSIKVSIE